MSQCRLLYRRDAAGPVTYVVECDGRKRFFAHGQLGTILTDDRVREIIAGRGGRWIEVSGIVEIIASETGASPDMPTPPPISSTDLSASAQP